MSNDPGKIAKTDLAKDGKPDHTTYSYGGVRRSYDSDKGDNRRNEHYAENGPSRDSNPVEPYEPTDGN